MYQKTYHTFPLALIVLLVLSVAGTPGNAQYQRRTAVVKAVEKTRASIVSVVVPKTPYQFRDIVSSGVIIDERGYIVTNHHVVQGRHTVKVKIHSGQEYLARVVHSFPKYDLAVLHVDAKSRLQALTLAPVGDLMVGEDVIAVGHPFGLTNTVSVGIISGLNRSIRVPSGELLTGLIQTDASINPGNSGGPLLNINGELIGVNTAIRDNAQNIAFAINAGTVRDLLKTHLSALKISGVEHGLKCKEKVLAEVGDRQRVEVEAVFQETPAAQAGLQDGDLILTVANRPVHNTFDVERALWNTQPGQKVLVKVQRNNKKMNVTLTLKLGQNKTVQTDPSSPQSTIVENTVLDNPQSSKQTPQETIQGVPVTQSETVPVQGETVPVAPPEQPVSSNHSSAIPSQQTDVLKQTDFFLPLLIFALVTGTMGLIGSRFQRYLPVLTLK